MDEIFFKLEQALQDVHYGFVYDSNQRQIVCKECDWICTGADFVYAVHRHKLHRNEVVAEILDAYRTTLL